MFTARYEPQLAWFKRADIFLKNVVSSRTTISNLVLPLLYYIISHTFIIFIYMSIESY